MKFLLLLIGLITLQMVSAQPDPKVKAITYEAGDLLFVDLNCGPLCDAIETVTIGVNGNRFSHIGMVYLRNDSVYVIEAIGKDVHLSPVGEFEQRSAKPLVHARLKKQYRKLIPKAIAFALKQNGVPYDAAFLYGNGKYYCSELIYDAFKAANHNKPFFELEPMDFQEPGKYFFFPVWVKYYAALKIPVPQGKPGINPGGISRSPKIDILH